MVSPVVMRYAVHDLNDTEDSGFVPIPITSNNIWHNLPNITQYYDSI